MRRPKHADELPDHLAQISVPETREEARLLLLFLESAFYSKCERVH